MSLTKLRDYAQGTDGAWLLTMPSVEAMGATRIMVTTDDGVCQGYQHPSDGRIWAGPLVQPTQAKLDADAAASAAASTVATKDTAARATVLAQVARVRAIPQGSRSDQDKWLLALSWLLYRQE